MKQNTRFRWFRYSWLEALANTISDGTYVIELVWIWFLCFSMSSNCSCMLSMHEFDTIPEQPWALSSNQEKSKGKIKESRESNCRPSQSCPLRFKPSIPRRKSKHSINVPWISKALKGLECCRRKNSSSHYILYIIYYILYIMYYYIWYIIIYYYILLLYIYIWYHLIYKLE
jgi:hypothetical protein